MQKLTSGSWTTTKLFGLSKKTNGIQKRRVRRLNLLPKPLPHSTPTTNERRQELHLPPVELEIIHGITMIGTYPVFYQIPVSIDFITAVWNCERPEQETVVNSYAPDFPVHLHEGNLQGMKPIANRIILLSCYEAFRQQFLE
jgi:hypothetical protein